MTCFGAAQIDVIKFWLISLVVAYCVAYRLFVTWPIKLLSLGGSAADPCFDLGPSWQLRHGPKWIQKGVESCSY